MTNKMIVRTLRGLFKTTRVPVGGCHDQNTTRPPGIVDSGINRYRGSNQRKELEILIARSGIINYEFEANVTPMAIMDISTAGFIEELTSPESFAQIAKNEEVVCVLYQERKEDDSVEKTYMAIDKSYRPVGILQIIYPLPDKIFNKLHQGILFLNPSEHPVALLDKITQNAEQCIW